MSIWKPELENYEQPLYRAIAESIRDAIDAGTLKPGDRLLPHRIMADELGVTIGTVAHGYKLAAEWGLVSGEVGRGSIIKNPDNIYPHIPIDLNGAYINLGILKPTPTTDPELRRQAYEDTLRSVGQRWKNRAFQGYPPEIGLSQHREAGASWIRRRGVQASADDVLLTAGSQEAFHLLLATYANPGDSIFIEESTHISMKDLGNFLNLRMVGLPLDDEGLIPSALDNAAKQTNAQILFLTPTLQSPTTAIMGPKRRQEIVDTACRNNLFIIENDPFSEFVDNAPPPIAHYAPERTAYVTTLSYLGSPEIRMGYMKIARKKVPELQAAKRVLAIAGSLLSAEIATHWINNGILERMVSWQTEEIRVRANSMHKILKGFDYQYLPNGLFLWLMLPEPWRASDFTMAANDRNVMVLGAERFVIGRGAAPHAIRISITSTQNRELFIEGLKILTDLLNSPAKANPLS
jgi:DNA-binding transcriptional MocR family regulator